MTSLPASTSRKFGLVIDLDICVGCHACAVNCKEWNTGGYGAPLADADAYGADPAGTWLNRIHTFEVTPATGPAQLVQVLPALRRRALRHRLPDGRLLQARRRRHRARERGPLHGLRPLRLGMPLQRPRARPAGKG